MNSYKDWEFKEAKSAYDNVYRDGNVLKWKTNNRCPMTDMLERWYLLSYITEEEVKATLDARQIEVQEFLNAYKENHHMSDEIKTEISANFDSGTVITDIITGETFKVN